MSISSSGNWPPSGPYLPQDHSKSMAALPSVTSSSPSGRFYPPSDPMFPVLTNNIRETEDHSPPVESPLSGPSVRHPGGGLNYVW